MKILVTGGAGYIGTHTCVELLNKNYEVIILDNFSNSKPQAITNIETITKKKVKFYEITPKGINVFNHIKFNWHEIGSNPIWKEFIHDIILNSFNEENLEDGNEVKK